MLFKFVFIVLIAFDVFLNIRTCKKDKSSFKENIPYNIETFILLFIAPSTMMNYYLINGCNYDNAIKMALTYLICSSVLSAFRNEKVLKKIVTICQITALNVVYIMLISEPLVDFIADITVLNVAFMVLTILIAFLTCLSITDILVKNIVYHAIVEKDSYNQVITATLYVILITFFSNVSIFRYYDNMVSILLPSSSGSNITNNSNDVQNVQGNNVDDTYSPNEVTPQDIIQVESSFPSIDDDIEHNLKHDYKNYAIDNGINWLINDDNYQNIELLNYLKVISDSENYNPFRITRLLFDEYINTEVTPKNFTSYATFDNSNNLYIDYSQYENEDLDTYVKRIYYKIMRVFYSNKIDLNDINIGEEDNLKYIFTIYYNEVSSTYDVLCLYFNFNDDTFKSIYYDVVSISENPMNIYSNYVDILPLNQTDTVNEKYQMYNVDNKYYVNFKCYG